MKTTFNQENDIQTVRDWTDKETNIGYTLKDLKNPVRTLYWAYKECEEQNRILTKIIVEALTRGIDLKTIETIKSTPPHQPPSPGNTPAAAG